MTTATGLPAGADEVDGSLATAGTSGTTGGSSGTKGDGVSGDGVAGVISGVLTSCCSTNGDDDRPARSASLSASLTPTTVHTTHTVTY